jgi:hypothetical protein
MDVYLEGRSNIKVTSSKESKQFHNHYIAVWTVVRVFW